MHQNMCITISNCIYQDASESYSTHVVASGLASTPRFSRACRWCSYRAGGISCTKYDITPQNSFAMMLNPTLLIML